MNQTRKIKKLTFRLVQSHALTVSQHTEQWHDDQLPTGHFI